MKVLILGASGLIGQALWEDWRGRPGWYVSGTANQHGSSSLEALDIRDAGAVRSLLAKINPEVTVLAAANPHVDYCETHPQETRAINVDATIQAAKEVSARGGTLVFISSDYVFDGKRGPYVETDPVNPINEYGRQKVQAEEGISRAGNKNIVLRVSGVFGWETARKNFVFQVLDRIKAKTPVQAAMDIRYRPTYAPNIAAVLAGLIESKTNGIVHAAGADEMSRYEFAMEIVKTFGLDPTLVRQARQSDFKGIAPRPACSSLQSSRLPKELASRLWGVRKALQHLQKALTAKEAKI